MVRRDLASSRNQAQRMIADSLVVVEGVPRPKAASPVGHDTAIDRVSEESNWVSRGALKPQAALMAFPADLERKRVLDVGASTGGFTQVALEHAGAAAIREAAVRRVIACPADRGLGALGLIRSPIEGGDGNVEYLLWLRRGRQGIDLEVPS